MMFDRVNQFADAGLIIVGNIGVFDLLQQKRRNRAIIAFNRQNGDMALLDGDKEFALPFVFDPAGLNAVAG